MNKIEARVILAFIMLGKKQIVPAILITLAFAFCCIFLSIHVTGGREAVLNGYEDCRGVDSFSIPNKCADLEIIGRLEDLELKSNMLLLFGFVLLFSCALLPVFINWRNEQLENVEIQTIKIPNNNC